MPPEIQGSTERVPQASSYERFVKSQIEQSLGRETPLSHWYTDMLRTFSELRVTRESKLAGSSVRVEKSGQEIARIVDAQGISVEGYTVHRKNPNNSEFSWHQPGIRTEKRIVELPTANGSRIKREISKVTVLLRDPKTGEILLAPKQDTFAKTEKKVLIGTAFDTNPDELNKILQGEKSVSAFGGLLSAVGKNDSIAQMVQTNKLTFFDAPPTDGNRTTEKSLGVVINVTEDMKKLFERDGSRWCSYEEAEKLGPVLDGETASALLANAGGNVHEYEYSEASKWYHDRLTKIGTMDVKHDGKVTDGQNWKVAKSGEDDEGVDGGHFKIRRYTEEKTLPNSDVVITDKIGIDQSEAEFRFPSGEGEVSLMTSGIVGAIKDSEGRFLLSVEPEPLAIDPGTSGDMAKPFSTYEPRGLLRTMQFSTQKLNDLLEGKNVDVGLADFFATVMQEGQNVRDLFKNGVFEVAVLPPADPNVINASNLLVSMTVEDKHKQEQLVRDGSRRWFTKREILGLAREGKINALTAAALFAA